MSPDLARPRAPMNLRRNAARWAVALALGLRQSEALALQWSDIDLDVGRLSVRRGLHRVPGQGLVFAEPKTDRAAGHRIARADHRGAAQAPRRPERGTADRRYGWHTAATLLLTAGVHPRVVMELLGHCQMRTTTDIYSHVMPALAQKAAERMSTMLWG